MNEVSISSEICNKIVEIVKASQKDIYLIGIVGGPGSGKSTISKKLVNMLENSINLPIDGYHKYLNELNEEQKKRRGSSVTFDLKKFKEDIIKLKQTKKGFFPDFDHAKKDPEENKIEVKETHKYVIVEGLWIFLNDLDVGNLFDLKIQLICSIDEMYSRLIRRHIETGLEKNEEDAIKRIKNNDELNFLYLRDNTLIDSTFITFNS